jgi:hypothetical protein
MKCPACGAGIIIPAAWVEGSEAQGEARERDERDAEDFAEYCEKTSAIDY